MRHAAITCRLLLAAALLLAGMLYTPKFAVAQDGGGASLNTTLSGPTRQKLLDTQTKLQNLHRQIAQISAVALQHNPALQEQEGKLRDLVLNTMKAAGYEPEKEMAHIKELADKLRSKGIDTDQKKQLLTDYQQTQTRLIAAQRDALGNQGVQQARRAYEKQLRQAMAKENPDSEALIQHYQEAQMEFRHQLEEAAKTQGGSGDRKDTE